MHNGLKNEKKRLGLLLGLLSFVCTIKAAGSPRVRPIVEEQGLAAAEQLLDGGADVNEPSDAQGLTPLTNAAILRAPGSPDLARDSCDGIKLWDERYGVFSIDTNKLFYCIKKDELSDSEIKNLLTVSNQAYDFFRARVARGEMRPIVRVHMPFIEAIYRGGESIVKKFMDLGEDVNQTDLDFSTPLMHAAYMGKEEMVNDFLERGANPKGADAEGNTALMHAVEAHVSPAVVQALITAGTPVNAVNKRGESALIKAAAGSSINGQDRAEAVRLLLAAGARVDFKTDFLEDGHYFRTRKTALDYAKEKGNAEIVAMLEEADCEQAKTRPSMLQRFWRWLEEDVERG